VCRCRRVYMMIKEIQMPILIRALPITLKWMVVTAVTDNILIHSQGHINWHVSSSKEITVSIPISSQQWKRSEIAFEKSFVRVRAGTTALLNDVLFSLPQD
jgi:hypothetical protein